MKHLYHTLIILLYIISGCNNVIEKSGKEISIKFNDPQMINYSSIFDSLEIIDLPVLNNELIGEISQVILTDKNVIISDFRKSKAIFIYSRHNDNHNIIRKIGRGPGEMVSPQHINILENEYIAIYDPGLSKILIYDLNGQFIEEKNLKNLNIDDIKYSNSNYFIVSQGEFRIASLNKDFTLNKILQRSIDGKTYHYSLNFLTPTIDGSFYYNEFLENSVHKVTNANTNHVFTFNFDNDIDKEMSLKRLELLDAFKELKFSELKFIDTKIDAKKFMLFSIMYQHQGYTGILNKVTGQASRIEFLNDMDGITSMDLFGYNKIPGFYVNAVYIPTLKNKLKDIDQNNSKGKRKYVEMLKQKYSSANNYDNPVLFIYKMKDEPDLPI